MKRYYYHVSYYHKGKTGDRLGDGILHTPEPIKTAESIIRVREGILADCGGEGVVVLLGFQLLRIEDVSEEVLP